MLFTLIHAGKLGLQVVGDLLGQSLMGIGDPLEKPEEYWNPCRQCLLSSGDILGKVQTKVEIHLVYCFPMVNPDDSLAA
jgi:hypothetical protein